MINKKKMRFAYWLQRLGNAVSELKAVDAAGWEAWYDDDNNVPDVSDRESALLVESRVIELRGSFPAYKVVARRDIFIWQDAIGYFVYSKEAEKDALYVHEFDTFDAAESFIRGLPIKNCGYGFVIDLLPIIALTALSTPLSLSTATSPQTREHGLEREK